MGGSFEDIKTFTAFLAPSPAFHSPYSNILYFPSKSSDDIQPRKDDIQPDDIQPSDDIQPRKDDIQPSDEIQPDEIQPDDIQPDDIQPRKEDIQP